MFKVEFPTIKVDLSQFSDDKIQAFCQKEALLETTLIVQDTHSGKDADGAGFRAYSAAYIKQILAGKVRGGSKRSGAAKTSTKPDIWITGELLGSIQTRVISKGAEIFFSGTHAGGISNASLAAALMAKGFKFFGFRKSSPARIESDSKKFMENAAKNVIVTK